MRIRKPLRSMDLEDPNALLIQKSPLGLRPIIDDSMHVVQQVYTLISALRIRAAMMFPIVQSFQSRARPVGRQWGVLTADGQGKHRRCALTLAGSNGSELMQ